VDGQSSVTTYLFTDIEGSTRLWEQQPERMRLALARHDVLTRQVVTANRGKVVKTTGDGFHAVFDDPSDALLATLQLQIALKDPDATEGVGLRVRSALHAGVDERRDNDFYGPVVNRAARIMSAAHGGQILVSQAVAALISNRLPKNVALRDLGRVRLRDLEGPEPVYQVVHPSLRQEFPALRSLEATPNNLPQQLTSFIDRENDLVETRKLFNSTRLLTLIGAGGMGKTRLSLQLAAEVVDDFADGVWFIELASLRDGHLVAQAVASAVGVMQEPEKSLPELLAKHFANQHSLLILDNCEHLIAACAELCKLLLGTSTHLRILASSREPMHIAGETTYSVLPLPTPAASSDANLSHLTCFASVRLFIERAQSVRPSFQPEAQDAAAIAEISSRLEGIPLAIELAAARIRALSPEAIAQKLSDRFRVLTSADTTLMPRQQTLRALIDWSYDLLPEAERVVFRRLSVFSGGWTLDAAEGVCAEPPIDAGDVVDLQAHLVEKSLVAMDAQGLRYRMLETVREYAQQRLDATVEGQRIRDRHLKHYLGFVETARKELNGANQMTWLRRLDLERENILRAAESCDRGEGNAEHGLTLASAAKTYWMKRGLLVLGHKVTTQALARTKPSDRTFARCRALTDAGQLAHALGAYEEALRHLSEGLSIAREIGDRRRIKVALHTAGMAAIGGGNLPMARGYLDEALEMARQLDDRHDLAAALNARAQLYRMEGDIETAEKLYDAVLATSRGLHDREGIAIALLNLAMVRIGRRDVSHVAGLIEDALHVANEVGSPSIGKSVLETCAGLGATLQSWDDTARFYGAAEAVAETTGLRRDPTDEAFLAPLIVRAIHELGADAFSAGAESGKRLSYAQATDDAGVWIRHLANTRTG